MGGVGEVAASEQVRRVREEPRAHRVALAGDRVGPGPRPADVAGHQGQVDRGLSSLDALMALVYPHRPPERDPLAPRDPPGGVDDRFGVQAGLARHELRVEPADERREFVKALSVGVDEGPVDRALLDQEVARPYRRRQVGLGADREMKRGRHRRLGPARVDDDDLRVVRIPRHPLPEHRVGDAGVRPDEDDTVATPQDPCTCMVGRRIRTPACRPRPPWPCTGGCCRRRGPCPCRTSRLPPVRPSPRSRSALCSGRRLRRRRARPGSRGTARSLSPSPRASRPVGAGRPRLGATGRSRGRERRARSGPPTPWGRPSPGSPGSRSSGSG